MEMLEGVQHRPKITRKRLNFEEDRISSLTDRLLLEIVSRLPCTKEAIRTGTLSKRWKHIWTSVHTLIFAHQEENGTLIRDRHYPKWRPGFFSFVNKTLNQCRQLKLKEFVVYTSYGIEFESQVNNWLRFAISREVEVLHLIFWYRGLEAVYLLDQSIFSSSSFTDLRLESCKLSPNGAISWKNLRSLCIYYAELDEDLIENILSGSPVLETLKLEDCYGYNRLDITSKSVKNLVYSGYMDFYSIGDEVLEINAPNILSLTIDDDLMRRNRKLLFVNVSSLVEANLDFIKFLSFERAYSEVEDERLKNLY